MSQIWMSWPQTLRTWVTISREMVGSIASPMQRTNRRGKTGCLGEVLVKKSRVLLHHFFRPRRQWWHYHGLAMWPWFVFFFKSLFFNVLFSFILVQFFIYFVILTLSHFVALGGSVMACRSIQCHTVALESDIDIFKSILIPMREFKQEHTSQKVAHNEGQFLLLLPGI